MTSSLPWLQDNTTDQSLGDHPSSLLRFLRTESETQLLAPPLTSLPPSSSFYLRAWMSVLSSPGPSTFSPALQIAAGNARQPAETMDYMRRHRITRPLIPEAVPPRAELARRVGTHVARGTMGPGEFLYTICLFVHSDELFCSSHGPPY